jgi:hypothetical protein
MVRPLADENWISQQTVLYNHKRVIIRYETHQQCQIYKYFRHWNLTHLPLHLLILLTPPPNY